MSDVHSFRWSYLVSTCLLVAVVSAVFLLLIHRERGQIVSRLTHRAAHAGTSEAVLAVRQLGQLPRPPIEPLVAAASSPSRCVALEAQIAIRELLRDWERQLNTGRSVARTARQLERLANLLHQRADKFSRRDYAWLAQTVERIVELSNQLPVNDDAEVAMQCEVMLALIPDEFRSRAVRAANAKTRPVREKAVTPVSRRQVSSPSTTDSVLCAPTSATIETLLTNEPTDCDSPCADEVPWTPCWMPPTRFQIPCNLSATPPRPPFRSTEKYAAFRTASDASRLESLSTRELLHSWASSTSREATYLECQLHKRGFHHLSTSIVEQLLSSKPRTRADLVYELTKLPGADAKAWLMLLADDPAAEVRLAAVTVMITSRDSELRQKAWEVAVHDRDPRIASLAERLRQ